MDVLWNAWRYAYIKSSNTKTTADNGGCVFCGILNRPVSDEEKFISWSLTCPLEGRGTLCRAPLEALVRHYRSLCDRH